MRATAAAVLPLVSVGVALAPPTAEARTAEGDLVLQGDRPQVRQFLQPDRVCEAARAKGAAPGKCEARTEVGVSEARRVTDAEIKMFGSQRLSNGKTLREVASVQAVWYRDWWQTSRGTYYVNWSEKHIGRFYFDKGVNIWWGSGGYHRCGYSSGVGYDVTPMSCSVYQAVPRAYDNHDQFRVSVLVNGFPMHTTHWMTARTWSSGSVQFFKST